MRASGDTADVLVYEQIGSDFWSEGITAKAFAEQLKGLGKGITNINVRINSPGGSVFEANAIYNTLLNHPANVTVHIDGAALSAASVIAMAGKTVKMAANAFLMIHDPMSSVRAGNAEDMRRTAEMLDKVKANIINTYAGKSKQTAEALSVMMSKETWLDAQEAKALGFVDEVTEKVSIAAAFDVTAFHNTPDRFKELLAMSSDPKPNEVKTMPETTAPVVPQAASFDELKAGCIGSDAAFLCSQLEVKATLPAAQVAWMGEQNKRIELANNATVDAKATAVKPGVESLGSGTTAPKAEVANPIAAWNESVQGFVKQGMNNAKATRAAAKANPELREQMVTAHNSSHGRA